MSRKTMCKKCEIVRQKEYGQTEVGKAFIVKYENSDKCKETRSAYAKSDKGRTTQAKHRKTDKFRVSQAKHRKTDKRKASYKKSEEKRKGTSTRKASLARGSAKRRAKIKGLPNTLTGGQWDRIQSGQDHKCAGCGEPFTEEKPATIDHIKPVCDGGGTTEENIQALCKSCNCIKGPDQWNTY